MKVVLSKKAEKNLGKIFEHTKKHFSEDLAIEVLNEVTQKILSLEDFPKLGQPIGGHPLRRKLVVAGNIIAYEIVLTKMPYVLNRNVIPRRTAGAPFSS